MGPRAEDDRPTGTPPSPAPLEPREPPYQALFPNLDRMSRSAFRRGTLSRSRIVRAAVLLVGVLGVIVAIAVAGVLL